MWLKNIVAASLLLMGTTANAAIITANFEGFIDQSINDDPTLAVDGDTFTGQAIYEVVGPSLEVGFGNQAAYIWSGTFSINIFAPNNSLRSTSSFSAISTLLNAPVLPSHIVIDNNLPANGDVWELWAARNITDQFEYFHMSLKQDADPPDPSMVTSLTEETVPDFSLADSMNISWVVGPADFGGNTGSLFTAKGELTSLEFSIAVPEPATSFIMLLGIIGLASVRRYT